MMGAQAHKQRAGLEEQLGFKPAADSSSAHYATVQVPAVSFFSIAFPLVLNVYMLL